MALILGTCNVLIPLTRDIFGPDGDRVIIGCIQSFSKDMNTLLGVCIQTEDNEFFIHPELFKGFGGSNMTFWAQLTLVDGVIEVHGVDPFNKIEVLPDEKVFRQGSPPVKAAPVKELGQTTVDTVLAFADLIRRQEGKCSDEHCEQRWYSDLNLRQAVLVQPKLGGSAVALCGQCFDKKIEGDSDVRKLIFDGRRLPYHSPVSIWSE